MTPPRADDSDDGRPDVHVLGTGGTIANITGNYDSQSDFATVDELLERAPEEIPDAASLSYTDVTHLSSSSLVPEIWFRLHEEITALARSDDPPDGFVVTHGSNTSEETAYFLNLTLETELPVVVTAAQRNATKLGSEGFRNLYDAVCVASHPDAAGRGVMLVANEEIHHSRDVTKLAANRPNAWASPNSGRIGEATPGVQFYHTPDRPSTADTEFDLGDASVEAFPLTDVHVVYTSLASDGTLVRAAMDEVAGFVVAGFPTCSPASPWERPQQKEALEEAVEHGIPVVVCNRGLEEFKHQDGAFIAGDTLRPQKARVLLALGLMETDDPEELQELFYTY